MTFIFARVVYILFHILYPDLRYLIPLFALPILKTQVLTIHYSLKRITRKALRSVGLKPALRESLKGQRRDNFQRL